MSRNDAVNLTRIMRKEGILRVSCTEIGFSVYMRGDILGTGETVGEAYESALRQRSARAPKAVAA